MFAAIWRVVSLAQTLLVQRSTHGSVNIEENAAYLVEHSLRACLAISGAPKFLHAAHQCPRLCGEVSYGSGV
jgi:hypothetical protein